MEIEMERLREFRNHPFKVKADAQMLQLIPYLASWSGSQDTKQLKACMDTIRRTAGEIIEEMDAFMAERMKELAAEKSAEQDTDRYTIYQIREGSPAGVFEFMGMDYIRQKGMEIRPEDYQEVYVGALVPGTTLEDLYIQFNGPKMPEDFTGHSLSVSDIVVVHKDGEVHAYYVDRFGYEEVPEFLAPVQAQEKAAHEMTAETESKPADAEKSEATRAGTVIPEKEDASLLENNHYAKLNRSSLMQPLHIKEHTAQLGREEQQKYQEMFVNKDINALSCSTTFEMGVDVGDLETV